MARTYDVAIVGGGIAGGALACVLARAGMGVLLLERQAVYRDRVLGEGMMPWGVAEARRAGIEDVLLDSPEGALTLTSWLGYEIGSDPDDVERAARTGGFATHLPGVAGILDVRHPVACEAFATAAAAAGATVVRGVSDVDARFGPDPSVSWSVAGSVVEAACRIVVGADGKVSAMRKRASIELREEPATSVAAGMLAGGLTGAPTTMGYTMHETDRHMIGFPQTHERSRLYVCIPVEHRTRYTGPSAVERFLTAWDSPSLPFGGVIAAGRQEGPCGTFPLHSAFVDDPVREGLVLIGDAAGWIDPLIGQGLSMAMRDARTVAEVLVGGDDWIPAAFAAYVDERRSRLAILALNAWMQQRLDVNFSPSFAERRPELTERVVADELFRLVLEAQTRGPERADPSVLDQPHQTRLEDMLGPRSA